MGCQDCYRMRPCEECINAELQREYMISQIEKIEDMKLINVSSGEDAFLGDRYVPTEG